MKHYLFSLLVLTTTLAGAQSLTIVSPEGLTEPYEVSPNTPITFRWDYFEEAPTTAFSYSEMPDFSSQPGADPAWTQYTNFQDNGDGTYNFTLTVTDEVWLWAGFYQSFFGSYAFSNVFHFQVSSGVIITGDDGYLCPGGADSELLSVIDTFPSYQWFRNNELISGATSSAYSATEPGAYKVQVPLDTATVFSNTLTISEFSLELVGTYNTSSTTLEISATSGFDSYQWYSGSDSMALAPITNEVGQTIAIPLPASTMYYAVEAANGSCIFMSEVRMVIPTTFAIPTIAVSADTNSFGNICVGTPITLSTDTIYGTYSWMRDGQNAYGTEPVYTFSQSYQAGDYTIEVTPPGWPEIILESEVVPTEFFDLNAPSLFSDDNDNTYCPGQTVNITLSDEGYNYSWYAYSTNDYVDSNLVEVNGSTYTFTYDSTMKITVVAEYQGCSKSTTQYLNNWADNSPYISLLDWNGGYLCTDSVEAMQVSPFSASNYQDYQWGRWVNDEFEPIADSTLSTFSASDTGVYVVQAAPVGCPVVTVISNSIHIASFLDRPMYVYASPEQICIGDTAVLHIQSGSQWQDIQWFKQYINGFNTELQQYNPIIGAGSESTQEVTELYRYRAKARYIGCPTGEKITSNIVAIRPKVNPTISVLPDYGVYDVGTSPFDSIQRRIFCSGEMLTLSVAEGYDQYAWLTTTFSANNYYIPGGEVIPGQDSDTLTIESELGWITAMVDSAGCMGYSDPILVDQWIFLAPVIQSYGNSELCYPGDSVLLNLGFAGDWLSFQWYLDGVAIPNSNNDSIYATQPGMYVLEAVPSLCPDFTYSSGVGPIVSFLDASIDENDSVIFALPELGQYTYQWYLNGEPIPSPANTPWILYKDSMADGIYTVAVTNDDSCTSFSGEYLWDTSGLEDPIFIGLKLYPNPSAGVIGISGIDVAQIKRIVLFDAMGRKMNTHVNLDTGNRLSIEMLKPGVYIFKIELFNGKFTLRKVVKI